MSSTFGTHYDPRLSALIAQTEQDWGDPAKNTEQLIFYGIKYVDDALFGIDTTEGEVIGIQGQAKSRKSTMLANIMLNIAAAKQFWISIDTLESGVPPTAYRDMLIAMTATRLLIAGVYGNDRERWPSYDVILNESSLAPELQLTRGFLRYQTRSKRQYEAIEKAKAQLNETPVLIFGPAVGQGNAKDLNAVVKRWSLLYQGKYPGLEGHLVRVFSSDHIQQFAGFGDNDYSKMVAVVRAFGAFVTAHAGSVVFAVSQVGVTSVRLAKQGMGRAMARGGGVLEEEVNVLFATEYDRDDPYRMKVSVPATRKAPPPPVWIELEKNSGAFLRPAYPAR